jgi:FtsH-binding integral membrane protein
MENQQNQTKGFKIIAAFFLVWNILGLLSFVGHMFMMNAPEEIAKLPATEQALYNSYPTWTIVVFALAVFTGLLASILLLAKKKSAVLLAKISLVAVLVQMSHNIFLTESIEVYGMVKALMMPILVILFAFLLLFYSRGAEGRGILK